MKILRMDDFIGYLYGPSIVWELEQGLWEPLGRLSLIYSSPTYNLK